MSVTFFSPDAPEETVRPYPTEPDYEEVRSTLPVLNLSNRNARVFLELLGESELVGTWSEPDYDRIASRCVWLLNKADARASAHIPASESRGTRVFHKDNLTQIGPGPLVIDAGLTDEQTQRYCETLLELIKQVRVEGYRISWC